MSSTTVRVITAWNRPGSHGVLQSFVPVLALDWHIHSKNKHLIEPLYRLTPSVVETMDDDDFEAMNAGFKEVLDTLDAYLKIRGTHSTILRKIRMQREQIRIAHESLKRGYAPGKMPSEAKRVGLADERLRQMGVG